MNTQNRTLILLEEKNLIYTANRAENYLIQNDLIENRVEEFVEKNHLDISNNNSVVDGISSIKTLPRATFKNITSAGFHEMSAYNSEAAQCDASPCTTANGFNVCEHGIEDTIAANFLGFGTKVRIPELFGDRVFIVRDRMNRRYVSRIDIWMKNKQDALKFGVKVAKIEVIE